MEPQATPQAPAKFDRVLGMLHDLPDVKQTRPSTVTAVMPILGDVQTYVVQTYRQGTAYIGFLQMVDADGRERIVIPSKVMAAIYRQRDSLLDRSTPESRARERKRRERIKRRKDKAARSEKWRARQATKDTSKWRAGGDGPAGLKDLLKF